MTREAQNRKPRAYSIPIIAAMSFRIDVIGAGRVTLFITNVGLLILRKSDLARTVGYPGAWPVIRFFRKLAASAPGAGCGRNTRHSETARIRAPRACSPLLGGVAALLMSSVWCMRQAPFRSTAPCPPSSRERHWRAPQGDRKSV